MEWLIPRLAEFSFISYWILGIAAFLEATPVIGTFVPGTIMVLAAATAAANGYFALPALAWAVLIGAFLGDIVSYAVGRSTHSFLFRVSFSGPDSPLTRAEQFFHKYGNPSIFFSHFFGPLRAFVPLAAGLARMPIGGFLIWAFVGACVWTGGMLAMGYILGTSFTLPVDHLGTYAFRAALLLIVIGLLAISARRMIRIARFVPNMFRSTLLWISQTRIAQRSRMILPFLLWVLRRFHVHRLEGLPLTVLVLIGAGFFTSASGMMTQILASETVVRFDTDVVRILGFIDSAFSITLALIFTTLGESGSVIIITALALFFLLTTGRARSALAFLFVLASTEATVLLTKILVERLRPESTLFGATLHTYAFPSAHAAIAVALFGYLAVVAMRNYLSIKSRTAILTAALLLILGVGGSRIILNVHYPSDVFVGYVIGSLWLAFTLSLEGYAFAKQAPTQKTSALPRE